MTVQARSAAASEPGTAAAVRALVRDADIEVIPLRSADEKLRAVPGGTTITVTCSAKLGLDRTLEYAGRAVQAGFNVVPHLAARQLTGEEELRRFVGRLGEVPEIPQWELHHLPVRRGPRR